MTDLKAVHGGNRGQDPLYEECRRVLQAVAGAGAILKAHKDLVQLLARLQERANGKPDGREDPRMLKMTFEVPVGALRVVFAGREDGKVMIWVKDDKNNDVANGTGVITSEEMVRMTAMLCPKMLFEKKKAEA